MTLLIVKPVLNINLEFARRGGRVAEGTRLESV